ncbi:amidohydrolase [Chitinophaga nivalis]|uniref:Amidohydrolase n=1 Tax=Chitinophaga nivalis TaxID=2991709 RepID=A0ABT3ING4_9BACT|nr:amidohydrolase [Chitinophaga nivalis]MCW3464820.1 amidohydrolase [Chitinophaga nivalis]MCW3485489.1 amidohydrolase [Chitinophaga nivalis]
MKKTGYCARYLICTWLLLLFHSGYAQDTSALIFYTAGGKILTMTGNQPTYVESVVVQHGKITYAGSKAHALRYKKAHANMRPVQPGEVLMPAFIDAHGHVVQDATTADLTDLSPAPYGTVNDIPAIQQAIQDTIRKSPTDTAIIIGIGYDDSRLKELRHPTKTELDVISAAHPVYVAHVSGHMGVANSKLLHLLGFDIPGATVPGGVIVKDGDGKPLGLVMENAHIAVLLFIQKHSAAPDPAKVMQSLLRSEKKWFSYGITTLCEGRADPNAINLVRTANQQGLLSGDFIVVPDYDLNRYQLPALKPYYNKYDGHFKIGAIKFTFDGSPQGRSAWLSQPYLNPPLGELPGYAGHPIYHHDSAYQFVKSVFQLGMQVHIHCNGDSAIHEGLHLIDTLKDFVQKDMINVLIHSQVCRPDQVPLFKKYNVMPSWFPTHCYIWGAWHRDSILGPARAAHISPLKQGLDNQVLFTIHTDAPVTPPDLLTAVYSAVNRRTYKDNQVLGPDQVISAYEALKAITINSAIQWGEANTKGTIEVNKRADLVLLKGNPLTDDQRYIKIIATFKDGQKVYGK